MHNGIYSQIKCLKCPKCLVFTGTESYEDFAKRIADMLLEPEKFRTLPITGATWI
jgi:hypothetical protein